MKKIVWLIPLFLAAPLWSQTCTTATCNAATANETDVKAALPAPGNTNATVVVNIPAGTANWTTDLVYTIPAAVTNLTIQGASTITWSGTPGQSSWHYTLNDQTIIKDADPSNNCLLCITTNGSSTLFRLSGLSWTNNGGATKYSGDIAIGGSSQGLRIDHIHFYGTGGGTNGQDEWVRVTGNVTGVIDHNFADEGSNTLGGNVFQAFDPVSDTIGLGDGAWLNGPMWGSLQKLYIESNYFLGGAPDDCNFGGRFVIRYNTLDSSYVAVQTHGTKSPGGPQRGCNSYEAYNNYLTGPSGSRADGAIGAKGGTALIFNNNMAEGYYRFYAASTDRNGGDSAPETNNPQGWGYCGTTVVNPATGLPNGVGSNWDGNQPTIATGYPCLDGLGRGQDTQALNGQQFPPGGTGRLNTVTGTIAWPHQYLDPIYMWNNTMYSGATYAVTRDLVTTNNQDYYYDQSAQSGSFTGAAGTGFGLHSARPATCAAGTNDTYHASPTGHYGVAYFETDTNSLFVCSSTNTWTNIYTPAVYPNPLAGGGGNSLTVTTSGAAGTISGTNCSSGSYTTGTTIGPCTANPGGGSTFSGWSVTGSAACSGTTNPCPSFTISTTTTINAAFTGTPTYTLSTSTAGGTGSGTVTCTPTGSGVAAGTPVSCSVVASGGSTISSVVGCGGTWTSTPYLFNMPASNCTVAAQFNLVGAAATPVWSPVSGTYPYGNPITISTATGPCGSYIWWSSNPAPDTTNGTNTQTLNNYVAGTYYAKVISCPSFSDSAVGSVTYAISSVAAPTFNPIAGDYGSPQTVTLATATAGATICYTTNGSTPTTNGAGSCGVGTSLYSAPFLISTTTTVKAVGTLSGTTDSTVATGTFNINGAVSAPIFSPGAGSYGPSQTVTITSTTPGGSTICYTNDGSTPTANGSGACTHGTTYSGTVSVSTSQTLKAVASKLGWNDSTISSAAYVINGAASTPTFSPVAGSYGATQNVVISSSTSGATICYTTNGATPTSSSAGVCAAGSTQYVSAVSVASSLTLKAIATKAGFSDSSVGSAAYVINGTVANVTFSPVAGSYGPAQSVTLSTATGSATICYTTDGTTPTATTPGTCSHGTTYSGAITVSVSETITALGTKAAFTNSTVTSAAYVINGTLATPTFNPPAGTYASAQSVAISSSSTIVNSMTETSNANDMAGNAVHRNVYTNCAESCSGGVPQPPNGGGISHGTLWCNSSQITTCGTFGSSSVSSTLTNSGVSLLENGLGQGGADSAPTVTSTFAGTTGTGCAVGATFTSNLFPGLTLPGETTASRAVFGLTTGSPGNTSMLAVSKYNTNGDAGNNLERIDCASPNTISVGGQHYEWDSNYNTAGGSYMGFGMDYNFTTSKFRAAFQNAPAWIDMELCPIAGGACITTYSWPAGDYLFSERHDYWDAGCTFSGPSNCAHYGQICLQLWASGSPVNSLTCYNIQDASTHLPISATPINKTTWTRPQYGVQHQWDVNATSATLTANVAFDSLVAFAPAATICYTVDGSTPTTDGAGTCTHGTTYSTPVSVTSNLTIKAIATQVGFTDSAVGSAAYVIGVADPTFSPTPGSYATTQSVTLADTTAGSTICYTTDGSTPTATAGSCTHGTTYSTAISVSVTTTIKALASKSGLANSNVVTGTYTINGTASTPTFSPVAGTYTGSQSVTISSTTAGATLCYTIDGTTPTADGAGTCTHGTTYSGAVTVSSSLTLKAVASKATFTDSGVGSAAYVIVPPAPTGQVIIAGNVQIKGSVIFK